MPRYRRDAALVPRMRTLATPRFTALFCGLVKEVKMPARDALPGERSRMRAISCNGAMPRKDAE